MPLSYRSYHQRIDTRAQTAIRAQFRALNDRIRGIVMRAAGPDSTIPLAKAQAVRAQVREAVEQGAT